MKNRRGFTDANNASPACSGARRKPFSMGKKPSNTRGIITLKSRWKTCSNKRKRIKDDPRDSSEKGGKEGQALQSSNYLNDKNRNFPKASHLIIA